MGALELGFWTDTTLTWIETNGLASVLVRRGDELLALGTVDASESGIEQIFWVMNPEKLRAGASASRSAMRSSPRRRRRIQSV